MSITRFIFSLLASLSLLRAAPMLETAEVFPTKMAGITLYRIPGLVVTQKGTVLAYCEARRNAASDWGEIEIHLRRSTDGGKTWAPPQNIAHRGPRLEGIDGAVLAVEFASSVGHSIFTAYFPDGTNIAYGRQQIDRRGARIVLPIQAKARIAAPYRAAFDYHCRLDMPADPIKPATRTDCIF